MGYLLLCPLLLHLMSTVMGSGLKDVERCRSELVEVGSPCPTYAVLDTPPTQSCLLTSANVSDISVRSTVRWDLHVKPAKEFRTLSVLVADVNNKVIGELQLITSSMNEEVWNSVTLERNVRWKLSLNSTTQVSKKLSDSSVSQVIVIAYGGRLTWRLAECAPVNNVTPNDTPVSSGGVTTPVVFVVVVVVVIIAVVSGAVVVIARAVLRREERRRLRQEAPDCDGGEEGTQKLGYCHHHHHVARDYGSSSSSSDASSHIYEEMVDFSLPVDGDSKGSHGQGEEEEDAAAASSSSSSSRPQRGRSEEERSQGHSYTTRNSLYVPFTELDLSPRVWLEDH